MKLYVADKVLLNTAAGQYRVEIRKVYKARNAKRELCEWYAYQTLDFITSIGQPVSESGCFNEYMADMIVKEVLL